MWSVECGVWSVECGVNESLRDDFKIAPKALHNFTLNSSLSTLMQICCVNPIPIIYYSAGRWEFQARILIHGPFFVGPVPAPAHVRRVESALDKDSALVHNEEKPSFAGICSGRDTTL